MSIITLAILFLYAYGTHAQMDYIPAADSIGKPGEAGDVSRSIKLTLLEYMFLPNEIWVTKGETVSFVVKNAGDRKHEMLIGTHDDLKKAAKTRRKHPAKYAAEPGLLQLAPGEQKELVWHFDEAGAIEFACPLPGHFKGMRGTIYVEIK
ncbi:plastocyanin/azurin family copper-binding protein [Nitrosomonas sp. Nm51]|uniref:cupredoxin domain-containing protein n=1 Tax=Nitrosomonas sp. Nm51 TaxID=133720 RepID=UPI00210C1710|nr:plastocyanin/azurin family copper-binding protein [Nitrosomonas sp. Nm51]